MRNIILTEEQFKYLTSHLLNEQLLTEEKNLVDNFNAIANLINITDPDQFFFIQIIKRWKDNKDKGMVKKVDGTYHAGGEYGNFANDTAFMVHSAQELMNLKSKIVSYCDANNARAYICCNPRSENATNNFLPQHINRLKRKNGGVLPPHGNFGFEHLAGQPKEYDPINFPTRLRFFLDVDTLENAYYIPRAQQMHVDKKSMRVDDRNHPQLRGCPADYTDSRSQLLFPKYPNQVQYIQSIGGLNVWDETRNILANNNVPIEMEYKTPSRGLHIVISDITKIGNIKKLEHDLMIFDDGINMNKVQLVHMNIDGKLILYSNVDTAGY